MKTYRIWSAGARRALLLLPVALALFVGACGLLPASGSTETALPNSSPQPSATAPPTTPPTIIDTRFLPTLRAIRSLVRHQPQGKPEQEVPRETSLQLNKGDGVNVDDQGHASLIFADAFKVEIFHDSQLAISGDVDPAASAIQAFALQGGTAFTQVERDKIANQRVRLTTEWAVIDDLGTEFVSYYNPQTEVTWIVVRKGLVEVSARNSNLPPAQRSVLVPAGKQTWVDPRQPPVAPVPAVRAAVGDRFPTLEELTNNVLTEAEWLPTLGSFGLDRTSVTSGETIQGTLTLSGPAYQGGVLVTLTNSDPAALLAPGSEIVPEGAASHTFTMTATAVTRPTDVDIIAAYGSAQHKMTLTILPPVFSPPPSSSPAPSPPSPSPSPSPSSSASPPSARLSDLRLNPPAIDGGTPLTGTVTLTAPAPQGGIEILLSSSAQAASVQPSVTIQGGQTSAQFSIATAPVRQDTQATITASDGATQPRQQPLTILAPPTLASFTIDPATLTGGDTALGEIALTRAAPEGGITVALHSDHRLVPVSDTVTIDAGNTSVQIKLSTRSVQQEYQVRITASYGGMDRVAQLTVTPPLPDLTVAIPENNPRQDCSSKVACFWMLWFTVTNSGNADVAQRFLAEVKTGSGEPQAVVVDSLKAHASVELRVPFNTQSCLRADCLVTATVDPGNTIAEASEDNNLAAQQFSSSTQITPEPDTDASPEPLPSSTEAPATAPN